MTPPLNPTTRAGLVDLIEKTAIVLSRLVPAYNAWRKAVARGCGGSARHALDTKAERYMELKREQEKQLEQLRSLPSHPNSAPSHPIPPRPVPSHPVPSHPVPSSPELQIVEGIESTWHYHLAPSDRLQEALCGARTMSTEIPLDGWGRSTLERREGSGSFLERWCRRCAETAGVQVPGGGGSCSSPK